MVSFYICAQRRLRADCIYTTWSEPSISHWVMYSICFPYKRRRKFRLQQILGIQTDLNRLVACVKTNIFVTRLRYKWLIAYRSRWLQVVKPNSGQPTINKIWCLKGKSRDQYTFFRLRIQNNGNNKNWQNTFTKFQVMKICTPKRKLWSKTIWGGPFYRSWCQIDLWKSLCSRAWRLPDVCARVKICRALNPDDFKKMLVRKVGVVLILPVFPVLKQERYQLH